MINRYWTTFKTLAETERDSAWEIGAIHVHIVYCKVDVSFVATF